MNYAPPEGFIDQPYFWCFDTDTVTDGSTLLNQSISLPGGFDFLLRRLVGVDSVLNPTTGMLQFRSVGDRGYGSQNLKKPAYFADRLIFPEITYLETGSIGFDLYNTLKASLTVGLETIPYGQIAFQGVRRRRGEMRGPGISFRRIPYHFKMPINFNWGYNSLQRSRKFSFVVDNFDFEMHDLYWTLDNPGVVGFVFEPDSNLFFFAQSFNPSPTLVIVNSAPNQVFSVVAAGTTVTITIGTNGGGGETTTLTQLVAGVNANPAALALMSVSLTGLGIPVAGIADGSYPFVPTYGVLASNAPSFLGGVAKFCLYDYAGNGLMPTPMRIGYLNEAMPFGTLPTPATPYRSGAVYPILLYPKDSAIAMDISSLTPTGFPYGLNLNAIGMQRIPC